MNVDQINATGHDITAFVVTAIILVLCAFALWGLSYFVAQYRRERMAAY